MKLSSPAFAPGGALPSRFARDGENINPPLTIEDIPEETRSLLLIMDDPDAPNGTFTHWVIFNLDPRTTFIAEGDNTAGGKAGRNSWGETTYGGPQPPAGTHRYFFHLYALDTLLPLETGAAEPEVQRALEQHVLGNTELMGTYSATTPAEGP